jgi:hypothetical protein
MRNNVSLTPVSASANENGARFIREKMNLTNDDNGAIGGADAG